MAEPIHLPDGRIREKASGSATAETTGDLVVTATFEYISEVEDVKSITLLSGTAYPIKSYSTSANVVAVTVGSVTSGDTVTVEVEAVGWTG